MTDSTEVATTTERKTLVGTFAQRYNIEPSRVLGTLKKTAFPDAKSDEEFMSLLVICNEYQLNPFLREIYAFSKDGRVFPMVGKDGWIRVLLRQPSYKGKKYTVSEKRTQVNQCAPCPEWVECCITFNDGRDPETARVYLNEWHRNTPTWKSMPFQMLKGKALKEAVREAFGINLYDEDDRDRILATDNAVTPVPTGPSNREKASALFTQTAPPQATAAQTVNVVEVAGESFDASTGEAVEDAEFEEVPDDTTQTATETSEDSPNPSSDGEVGPVEQESPLASSATTEHEVKASRGQQAAINGLRRSKRVTNGEYAMLLGEYGLASTADANEGQADSIIAKLNDWGS